MLRAIRYPLILSLCLLVTGCAGQTYAPVVDRTGSAGSESTSYRVSRGDTLYSIAWRHGLNYRNLAAWNDIAPPYTIYPGQTLRLSRPAGNRESRRATAPPPARDASDERARASNSTGTGNSSTTSRETERGAGSGIDWRWPVDGEVLKPFTAEADGKQGVNLGGREGEDVLAAASGRVVYSGGGLVGYGNLIILKHGSDYLTAYGYNDELLVAEGDQVKQGQVIARMGRNGSRAMLHFELRREGRAVDPLAYLPPRR